MKSTWQATMYAIKPIGKASLIFLAFSAAVFLAAAICHATVSAPVRSYETGIMLLGFGVMLGPDSAPIVTALILVALAVTVAVRYRRARGPTVAQQQ